jgi:SAM-dependent methyltransferase
MVRQIVDRFLAVVKHEGLTVAFAKAMAKARRVFPENVAAEFDAALNTETSRVVPLWRLKIPFENSKHGSEYRTTHPSVFQQALSLVPGDIGDLTFIDIGCGKGRTLILASQWGFKKIIGVEFSPELAAVARRNISTVGICAEVVEIDACQFSFPDENLLIYMYNPFGPVVMRSLVHNLLEWHENKAKQATLVYVNPVYNQEFKSESAFECVRITDGVQVWLLRESPKALRRTS